MKRRHAVVALGSLAAIGGQSARAGSYVDFFRAIEVDNVPAVRALLLRGFDPNTRDEKGQVALYVALRSPSPKVAALLVEQPELEVDATNAAGETPLMMAAMKGNAEIAQALVARGAQIVRPGWTPLHYAASGPDSDLVAWLIARGAVVEARSPNGTTPLMMAARYGSEASVRLLLKNGADRTLRNDQGLTAADFARQGGRDWLADAFERSR